MNERMKTNVIAFERDCGDELSLFAFSNRIIPLISSKFVKLVMHLSSSPQISTRHIAESKRIA